jgi:2-phospho-L-lactate guanylyltransferase
MHAIVPFDARDPKTRLDDLLVREERRSFAQEMLQDVLETLAAVDLHPEVLSTAPVDCAYPVRVDERPLTVAVNSALEEHCPVVVVMADLALLTPGACERLLAPEADVVIAPGLGGGTNALVVRHPEFQVDYHGVSFRDHQEQARACGAALTTVDSFRLGVDVDTVGDLLEVLVHTDRRAADWLRDAGISSQVVDGKPTVTRE